MEVECCTVEPATVFSGQDEVGEERSSEALSDEPAQWLTKLGTRERERDEGRGEREREGGGREREEEREREGERERGRGGEREVMITIITPTTINARLTTLQSQSADL